MPAEPGWIRACGWIRGTMVHKNHPGALIHPNLLRLAPHDPLAYRTSLSPARCLRQRVDGKRRGRENGRGRKRLDRRTRGAAGAGTGGLPRVRAVLLLGRGQARMRA